MKERANASNMDRAGCMDCSISNHNSTPMPMLDQCHCQIATAQWPTASQNITKFAACLAEGVDIRLIRQKYQIKAQELRAQRRRQPTPLPQHKASRLGITTTPVKRLLQQPPGLIAANNGAWCTPQQHMHRTAADDLSTLWLHCCPKLLNMLVLHSCTHIQPQLLQA